MCSDSDSKQSTVWCLVSSSPHNELQVHELAAYALPLLQSDKDVAVLPSDPSTREFADFCKEILGLKDDQVVWVRSTTAWLTARQLEVATRNEIERLLLSKGSTTQARLIPYGPTKTLEQWLAGFKEVKVRAITDDIERVRAVGNKSILHRHVQKLEQASVLEGTGCRTAIARGYVCTNVDQLLIAYRLLGVQDVVIKPVHGKEGEGVLFVSSSEELRLYDFPLGTVVLEESLVLDRHEDGIPVSGTVLQLGSNDPLIMGYEKVNIGSIKFGMRSLQVSQAFQDNMLESASGILSHLNPPGPAHFDFVAVGGQPILLGVRFGQLQTEHFVQLFLQRFAEGCCYFSWHFVPQQSMDVWTFWSRLLENNVAFVPGASKSGVFPLVFLKGLAGTFVAIGTDMAEVTRLRSVADDCLREPVVEQKLELVSWRDDVRRIWCSGPRPEYRRQTQRFNLPNRCIPLIRKDLDVIILPGGHEGTMEFANFCKEVLDLSDDQIIFTSGKCYNLDDDVDDVVLSRLRALIVSNPNDTFTLVPYSVTPNFDRWARKLSELGVRVFGESLEWISKYGHKGILHRHVRKLDEPSLIEQINPKTPVADGYYCETVDDLLLAYSMLKTPDVVVKPVFGAAGEGILFVHSEEELKLYDFPMGAVCLEEFLELDRAPDGIILSPALHYMEMKLVGTGLVDQIMIGTTYSGWRRSSVPRAYQHQAVKTVEDILQVIQPLGPGGFDFLSVKGKPVLTDVNTGRFNGAHSPKIFMELYAPGKAFYVYKAKPPEKLSVWTFWQRLLEKGLAFIPGKTTKGVFPMIFLPGLSGQCIAIADTDEEACALRFAAEPCMEPPQRPTSIMPKLSVFKRADILKRKWRRVWVLSPPNSKFGNMFSTNTLSPLHAAALLRPGTDLIMLPYREDVCEFWNFIRSTLELGSDQVVWTSGDSHCMHLDIDDDVVRRLSSCMEGDESSFTLVPDAPVQSFHKWAAPMIENGMRLVGDDAEFMSQFAHRGIVYDHISNAEKQSPLKGMKLQGDVRLPKGFVCSNTSDLLEAYSRLGSDQATVRPIRMDASPGEGTLQCSSVKELEFYDFPLGDVVLEEVLTFDRAPDGQVIEARMPYLSKDRFGGAAVDVMTLGGHVYGFRPSVVADETQQQIAEFTHEFLAHSGARGAGALSFGFTNGQPVLKAIMAGRFCQEHIVKLFLEQHAQEEEVCFEAWHYMPPKGVNVWTFWTRLVDRGLAMRPCTEKSISHGVFPLVFLKGVLGLFVAIGPDMETVRSMRAAAEECLRVPVHSGRLRESGVDAKLRRIYCMSSWTDCRPDSVYRYSIPTRSLLLMRPNLDVAVLPGGHELVTEFAAWVRDLLGLGEEQIVWTSGANYMMDADVDDRVMSALKAHVISAGHDAFQLVPMTPNPTFLEWSSEFEEFGVTVLGSTASHAASDSTAFTTAILHRHIRRADMPCAREQWPDIAVPRGFNCSSVDDLVDAYKALGCGSVVLRPLFSIDHEDVLLVTDEEQLLLYDFPYGSIVMQEELAFDRATDGMAISFAVPFVGSAVLSSDVMDEIMVGLSCMGLRTPEGSKRFRQSALNMANELLQGVNPVGMGTLCFASVNGDAVLYALETFNFSSIHACRALKEQLSPGNMFWAWKFKPPVEMNIQQFWSLLKAKGLALVPGVKTTGVIPLYYLRGLESMLIAIGKSALDCILLHDKAKKVTDNALKSVKSMSPFREAKPKMLDLTMIKNAEAIYSPELLEERHLLIAGGKIIGILTDAAAEAFENASPHIKILDATGCIVTPGFVDCHCHITGGGGEAGPASRCPASRLSDFMDGGVTTVVGLRGTDDVSRTQEEVIVKARALTEEGMTAYTWIGNYHLPVSSATGDVKRDMCCIESSIGVGEVAISDHRSSAPTTAELARLACDVHVAGMLSGKAGVLHIHVGPATTYLQPIRDALKEAKVPITVFMPTHMDRSEELIDDGAKWLSEGGVLDITGRSIRARKALQKYCAQGLPLSNITVSSDAFGSLPSFDEHGRIIKYTVADAKALLRLLRNLYFQDHWPLERILPLMTSNPARILKLRGKGVVAVGADADLLVLSHAMLKLQYVMAKGNLMKGPGWTQGGFFERGSKIRPFAHADGMTDTEVDQEFDYSRSGLRSGHRRDTIDSLGFM